MSYDLERQRVKHRVERLQKRTTALLGHGGDEEELRMAFETELVQARREGFLEGKHEGFKTARLLSTSAMHEPRTRKPTPRQSFPAVDPSTAPTPINPTDWVRGKR